MPSLTAPSPAVAMSSFQPAGQVRAAASSMSSATAAAALHSAHDSS